MHFRNLSQGGLLNDAFVLRALPSFESIVSEIVRAHSQGPFPVTAFEARSHSEKGCNHPVWSTGRYGAITREAEPSLSLGFMRFRNSTCRKARQFSLVDAAVFADWSGRRPRWLSQNQWSGPVLRAPTIDDRNPAWPHTRIWCMRSCRNYFMNNIHGF